MNARRAVALALLAASLAACSGSSNTGTAAGGTNPGGTNPGGGTHPGGTNPGGTNPGGGTNPVGGGDVVEPPGTTQLSSSSGSAAFQVGANLGPGGALFFNDRPQPGEARISGLVVVRRTDGSPVPTDTVVTLNGVDLVHTASPDFFTVDPAGPQPTLGTDGFLHLVASSASAGLTRTLDLACPFAIALTATPAAGSSLAGVASVRLDWAAGSLPVQGRDFSAFGLAPPEASLHGFDPATQDLTFVANGVPIAPDALGVTVPVGATSAPAYAVELRYPGVFFLDGESGGACGRTQRLVYSK